MTGATRRLSVLDSTFLRIETDNTPMHVGALMTFEIPDTAAPGFVAAVVERFRGTTPLRRPFNQVLAGGVLSAVAPAWRTLETVDMEFHVRHTALPAPGGERALGELVSHLHSSRLDRTRPLWTCHVIEGLEGNRFALYVKIHHALTDGINGTRLGTGQLATTPDGAWLPPWHEPTKVRVRRPRPARLGVAALAELRRGAGAGAVRGAALSAERSGHQRPKGGHPEARPRARAVDCHAGMQSMNGVFLAVCGDALRRYPREISAVPERSLVAGVPVDLRQEGEVEAGNAVGFLWALPGTDLEDPVARLEMVNRSMRAAKAHLRTIDPSVRPVFTLLTMALPVLVLLSGQGARIGPPSMNVTISNVPGPPEVRYLAGARMAACYPVSVLFQGLGLNITCISYAGQFDVGIVGGRDALPSLQKIAVYLGEALDVLEEQVVQS